MPFFKKRFKPQDLTVVNASGFLWRAQDLALMHEAGEILTPLIGEILDEFYVWLMTKDEGARFLTNEQVLTLKRLQHSYWAIFFKGKRDDSYVASRETVG